jgi:peptidoglycan/xylan/chitin deacetylase (PgdA/CDA1 family)
MNVWAAGASIFAASAGLAAWGAFHPASQLFGATLRRLPDNPGGETLLALTFDDGPNPAMTPRLLDILAKEQVRATFFLIGEYVRAFPALAGEIAARGHAIGNHTDTHPSLVLLSRRRIAEEFRRCQEAIAQATGRAPVWMRPPRGFRSPQMHVAARQAGFRGVAMWSTHARDWKRQPASDVIARLRRVRPGDIVLLHDGAPPAEGGPGRDRWHTLAAVEHWLPRWKERGWKFVTLDDIPARAG